MNEDSTAILDNVFHAAPGLTRVEVDLTVAAFDASLMRNGVVSLRRLSVHNGPASFPAFLADARRCLSLSEMQLYGDLDAPDIEALLNFALNKPLTALGLIENGLTQAAMPSLTRLVSAKCLTTLDLSHHAGIPALEPSPVFCDAVAAAPLVSLYYVEAGLFDNLTAGLSLLTAVTRHPTLRFLAFYGNTVAPAGRTAVGAALGQLVAADSPLIALDITRCDLGNDGLLPFIDALPRNTHLRRLECEWNDVTQLTAARLLAAVRATASLIHLKAAAAGGDPIPELVEAEAVVTARE